MATYTKLKSGDWGIKCPLIDAQPGATIAVTKKDGSTKYETITKIIWKDNDTALCAIEASTAKRSFNGGRFVRQKKCVTGGNCSSFGSGRSCGAEDCDGF